MPKLSDKARQEAEKRREGKDVLALPESESARPAPSKPSPEPHGGIAGKDHPIWQAMRQARDDGLIVIITTSSLAPEAEATEEFVGDVRLARPILAGALRRAERGESRVEITLREVKL